MTFGQETSHIKGMTSHLERGDPDCTAKGHCSLDYRVKRWLKSNFVAVTDYNNNSAQTHITQMCLN